MFNRKLTSAGFDYVAGSLVCYAGAIPLAVSAVALSLVTLGVVLTHGKDKAESSVVS